MPQVPEIPQWASGFVVSTSGGSLSALTAAANSASSTVAAAFNRFKAKLASPSYVEDISAREDGELPEIPAVPASTKGKQVAKRHKRKSDAAMDCE